MRGSITHGTQRRRAERIKELMTEAKDLAGSELRELRGSVTVLEERLRGLADMAPAVPSPIVNAMERLANTMREAGDNLQSLTDRSFPVEVVNEVAPDPGFSVLGAGPGILHGKDPL